MRFIALVVALVILVPSAKGAAEHGLSLYGELKYPPDFKHFDYVNPDAPKGGAVKYEAIGTFDTLNPFTLKGVPAAGVGLIFDTLARIGAGRAGRLIWAHRRERRGGARPQVGALHGCARRRALHDGTPITPEDVIWTFDTLKAKGHPRYRLYYADVREGREGGRARRALHLPQQRQPRAAADRRRDAGAAESLLGEARFRPRRRSTRPWAAAPTRSRRSIPAAPSPIARVDDYWAKDLPVNVGRHNFATIRYDYYRDQTIALEAFKAGQYDIRIENVAKNWAIGYDGPALQQGLIKKEEIPNKVPEGMQAFVFNTRRPLFKDARVRQALGYLFDFEWADKNLFYGAYTRTEELFLQLRPRLVGHAARRRAQDPRTAEGRDSGRGLHHAVRAARDRRLGQYPRQSAPGAEASGSRRLEPSRTSSSSTRTASPSRSSSCWCSRSSSASCCRSRKT